MNLQKDSFSVTSTGMGVAGSGCSSCYLKQAHPQKNSVDDQSLLTSSFCEFVNPTKFHLAEQKPCNLSRSLYIQIFASEKIMFKLFLLQKEKYKIHPVFL